MVAKFHMFQGCPWLQPAFFSAQKVWTIHSHYVGSFTLCSWWILRNEQLHLKWSCWSQYSDSDTVQKSPFLLRNARQIPANLMHPRVFPWAFSRLSTEPPFSKAKSRLLVASPGAPGAGDSPGDWTTWVPTVLASNHCRNSKPRWWHVVTGDT